MQIFKDPNYNFIKWRWHAVIASAILIAIGLGLFLTRGVNLGIDFAGGASIILKFRGDVPLQQLRSELPGGVIQQFGPAAQNSVQIRLPQSQREGDYAGAITEELHRDLNPGLANKHDINYHGSDGLAVILQQADPDNKGSNPAAVDYYKDIAQRIIARRSQLGIFTTTQEAASTPGISSGVARVINERTALGAFNVLNQETVGPQVGSEMKTRALWAIILSSLAMGLYIWLRFRNLKFGVAAIVCIIHDVLVALTFMTIMRLEFSLNVVAALLTVVGYSINDTVVTYDRVRENQRKIKRPMALADHLNLAMNQTLSRTILTAGTVFLVLLAMLVFGGEVIRGFSWILTIGVVSGTYSTLFIVPAVVVALDRWKGSRQPPAAAQRMEAPRDVPVRNRKAS